jgi:hypothetical protein
MPSYALWVIAAVAVVLSGAAPCPDLPKNRWIAFSDKDRPPTCNGEPARAGGKLVCVSEGRAGRPAVGGILELCANRWTGLSSEGAPPPIPTQMGGIIDFLFPTEPHAGKDHLLVFGAPPINVTEGPARFQAAHILDLVANRWSRMNREGEPSARQYHGEAWDGRRLFVWGGALWEGANTPARTVLGDGALFDLQENVWTPVSAKGAPSPRTSHALWTGHGVFVFTVCAQDIERCLQNVSPSGPAESFLYEPRRRSWKKTRAKGHPSALRQPVLAWTGDRVIVFGTKGWENIDPDGGLYDPARNRWTPIALHDFAQVRHRTGQLGPTFAVGKTVVVVQPCDAGDGASTVLEVFNPARNAWRRATVPVSMCSPQFPTAALIGDDGLYWLVGDGAEGATLWRYDLVADRLSRAAIAQPPPFPRSAYVQILDGILTATGGFQVGRMGNDCDGAPPNSGCDPSRPIPEFVPVNSGFILVPELLPVPRSQ